MSRSGRTSWRSSPQTRVPLRRTQPMARFTHFSYSVDTDAMASVSTEYEKWVKRAMGWVRRKGTRVWGLERHEVRPDLDIDLSFVNSVYALPGALIVRGCP